MMMKKQLFSILLLTILYSASSAQVTEGEKKLRTQSTDTIQGWKTGGVIAINLAQTSLTNWVAGGQNSVATNGILSVSANYKRNKSVWVNTLDMGYGLLKQGKKTGFRKTDDKIDFLSKYGFDAFKNFYYAALFNFKTQMTPGYNYPNDSVKISDLFSPAYFLIALGMDFKPDEYLSVFLAPVTARIIYVRDKVLYGAGAFGVEPGKKSKSEVGGYFRAIYTKNNFKSEILKNVSFTTKVDLFTNYNNNPQNFVVNWETLIAFKVNRYISANLNTQLLYDDKIKVPTDKNKNGIIEPGEAVGSLIQYKEILGAGFSYNF
jgi:hypothetical protein